VDTAPEVDAVVFDLGGLFFDWDPRHLYRKLFGGDDEAMERFLAEVCTESWHQRHDAGVDHVASCRALAAHHPEQADLILAWSERSEEMVGGVFEDMVALLVELTARHVRCYALSNMEAETFPRRRDRFPFLRWFDGCVISGFERVAKPDPAIFEVLLARFELEPSRTLFLDANLANVEAAARLGIRAELFRSAADCRRRLVVAAVLPG